MAYNETQYSEKTFNTGLQKGCDNPGAIAAIILAPAGTSFADFDDAVDFTVWEAAINADRKDRIYVLPGVFEMTDQTEEPVTETSQTGQKFKVREEVESYMFALNPIAYYNYLQLRKLNGCNSFSFVFVYQNGTIGGQSSDGVKFEFRPIQYINVPKLRNTDGATAQKVMLELVVGNGDLFHSDGAIIAPLTNTVNPWNPINDLIGIKDCKIAITNPTATGAVATVTGFADNVPIEGLVKEDFSLKTAAGVVVTITSATEGLPGVYTLVYPTATGAHTFAMANQPDMTTKYFETPAVAAFTIA